MPRNRALVRNLTLLKLLEQSRVGLTLAQMASETGVTTRTIRRDLIALQEAGIPLVDNDDDRSDQPHRWRAVTWRHDYRNPEAA